MDDQSIASLDILLPAPSENTFPTSWNGEHIKQKERERTALQRSATATTTTTATEAPPQNATAGSAPKMHIQTNPRSATNNHAQQTSQSTRENREITQQQMEMDERGPLTQIDTPRTENTQRDFYQQSQSHNAFQMNKRNSLPAESRLQQLQQNAQQMNMGHVGNAGIHSNSLNHQFQLQQQMQMQLQQSPTHYNGASGNAHFTRGYPAHPHMANLPPQYYNQAQSLEQRHRIQQVLQTQHLQQQQFQMQQQQQQHQQLQSPSQQIHYSPQKAQYQNLPPPRSPVQAATDIVSAESEEKQESRFIIERLMLPFFMHGKEPCTFEQMETKHDVKILVQVHPSKEIELFVNGSRPDLCVSELKYIQDSIRANTKVMTVDIKAKSQKNIMPHLVDVFTTTGCSVDLGIWNGDGEAVSIRGNSTKLPFALTLIMEQANSRYFEDIRLRQYQRTFLMLDQPALIREHNVTFSEVPSAAHLEASTQKDLTTLRDLFQSILPDQPLSIHPISPAVHKNPPAYLKVAPKYASFPYGLLVGSHLSDLRELLGDYITKQVDVPLNLHSQVARSEGVHLTFGQADSNYETPYAPQNTLTIGGSKHDVNVALDRIERLLSEPQVEGTVEADRRFISRMQLGKIQGVDILQKKGFEKGKVAIVVRGLRQRVNEVTQHLDALAEKLQDETTQIIQVDAKHHKSLIGPGGKYKKRLETKYDVSIAFARLEDDEEGNDRYEKLAPNEIRIRGPRSAVASAVAEIQEVVDYEVQNSQVVTMEIQKKYSPIIIGKKGSKILSLQSAFDVRIKFIEDANDPETEILEIRGTASSCSKAKKELLRLIAENDDIVTETCTLPSVHHSALIGSGGRTLRALLDKTEHGKDISVKFPKDKQSDGVVLMGHSKGVAEVKQALLNMLNTLPKIGADSDSIDIPQHQHVMLIGPGGSVIQGLRTEYNVIIDVPPANSNKTSISMRGEAVQLEAVKKRILEIVGNASQDQIGEEIRVELSVPKEFHRVIIGKGGENIRRIQSVTKIRKIDVPSDTSESETVLLVGSEVAVENCKAEIEKITSSGSSSQQSTIIMTVPQVLHRNIIGTGGSTIEGLRSRAGGRFEIQLNNNDRRKLVKTDLGENDIALKGHPDVIEKAKQLIQKEIVEAGETSAPRIDE